MKIISRKDAKAAGLARYFTGKPCRKGHIAERYVQGSCIVCNAGKYKPRTTEQKKQHAAYMRNRLAANPEIGRRINYKTNYGITPEDYDRLLAEQGGRCAICRTNDSGNKRTGFFFVDHCHRTDVVRGLLCHHCNMILGYSKDNPSILQSASDYLYRSPGFICIKEAA